MCEIYTIWIPSGPEGQLQRYRTGLTEEDTTLLSVWQSVNSYMLREMGRETLLTDIHTPLSGLGKEFEAVPWTDEHAELRSSLFAAIKESRQYPEDETTLRQYSVFAQKPGTPAKCRYSIAMEPRLSVWVLFKHMPDVMLCETGSDVPITDLHKRLIDFDSTVFDGIPWTDEYAYLRDQLDRIPGHWHP